MTLVETPQTADAPPAPRFRSAGASWAVADQMLISGTNFVTMVFLARGMSQAEFGGFTLVYSTLLLANSLQSGLVTQPHNVLGASRVGEEYDRYTTSTAVSQVVLTVAFSLIALAAWGVASACSWGAAPLLGALGPSIVAWQLQEFVRRVFYTEGRLGAAFANDVVSYGGQAAVVIVLERLGVVSGVVAMLALTLTSALGAILGTWQLRRSLAGRVDRDVFRENWHYGKWLAGTEIVGTWLSSQLLIYLAAATLGAAAAGILRAVHTLFGPTRVLGYVFNSILPIRFTRALTAEGKEAVAVQVRRAFLVAVPLLGGYCLLAGLFAEPILRLLYGDRYVGQSMVLALYAVFMFFTYLAMILAAALQAMRLTRQVFMSRLYGGLLTIPLGYLMILALGVPGAVLGSVLSSIVIYYISWRAYRSEWEVGA